MYCMLDNKRMREGKKTKIYIFFLLIVHTHARMHARTHASLIAQLVKNLPANTRVEKAVAPHSSTLAWKIPWMEEPGGLQSMGSRKVGHD